MVAAKQTEGSFKPFKHPKLADSFISENALAHNYGKTTSELQRIRGIEDNSDNLFLNKNIHCDPSLEPSWRDSSNDWSQYMFQRRNMEIYP